MPGSTAPEAHAPAGADPAPRRRLPIGAEYQGGGRAHLRVWAPAVSTLDAVVDGKASALDPEAGGYFSGFVHAAPGSRYQLRLDGERLRPDPASRFQPEGVEGPSEVVDPGAFQWNDHAWRGLELRGQVLYEMHAGTFTRAGSWNAAAGELAELAALGITAIELMPVAEFNGRFGWGYDGVDLFAPSRLYGRPDDLRRFVDTAHGHGLGVILDVVYNHLGPVGNFLRDFAPSYFSQVHETEWGAALNFDGPDAGPVRELVLANAAYWIDEFHLDGLRLDATQQIYDTSERHVLRDIASAARAAAGSRSILLIAENEPQDARLVRPPDEGGHGLDAVWNDDFHHSAMVALTGRAEAYYSDTRGTPQELLSAAKYGFLFQGQPYHWQRKARGTPAWDIDPARFVVFLQNHDQVANSARGLRGHALTSPGRWRAMTALLLLMPGTPMLFQGQEFSSSAPFLYFADHGGELGELIRKGRTEFLTQFPSIGDYLRDRRLEPPDRPEAFERSVLDFAERDTHREAYALHRDLLRLRREDTAFRAQRRGAVDGAVIGRQAFILRFFAERPEDHRLLAVNLGADLMPASIAEPLIAPPSEGLEWTLRWSSEAAAYGGSGTPRFWGDEPADHGAEEADTGRCYVLAGECAFVLAPAGRGAPLRAGIRRRTA